jgi:hypothetical protein
MINNMVPINIKLFVGIDSSKKPTKSHRSPSLSYKSHWLFTLDNQYLPSALCSANSFREKYPKSVIHNEPSGRDSFRRHELRSCSEPDCKYGPFSLPAFKSRRVWSLTLELVFSEVLPPQPVYTGVSGASAPENCKHIR